MEQRRNILRGLVGGAALWSAGMGVRAQTPFRSRRITVTIRGRGPDVLLIPGLASTAEVWRGVADRLAGRRRLHLVSVRGFGDLPAGANASGAVMAAVAAEVRRYIAEQGLERPALIGHSMGGQVGLRVAADAGGRIGRVMVVDSSPFFPALISPQATVGDVEPIAQLAYQAIHFLGDEALRARGRQIGLELGGATDAVFGAMGWQGGDRRVLAQSLYEVMTVDLRRRLPDITAPVTVVYGWSADGSSPRSRTDRLFRGAYARLRIPAAFVPIEGAEHMVMIDQPTRFQAAVDRFLA
ncbi:MAG: alpha/beta hydrolase [Alphaproteobacteria bacterium]|jgi:pimeloyl-[acyl-carrier protein] methyl ester esterase|nr:alpha/beta hydrolase [Alphaproteobacteria bacterium]MBU2043117.1 alpha/beta hydrolase [Alphaproteobacteria bacterium]MBU2124447.1 alpha/beta hydrolase [Alphaproteobacteria bacterium]MBU2207703.1 alpha/beta hydrolase [Alphaproteobacteria bacterium]MBU2290974.1 alpha/beta hydrolase [Alphaproteobacteria bacterium]